MHFFPELRASLVSVAPEALLRHLRARRRSTLFREAGVAFVHVPRTAGTSAASAIYGRFIGHFGLADLLAAAPADVLALPRFTLVRNPWDRLVSAWSFARAGGGRSEFGMIRMHRPELYAGPEFASFAGFVETWLAARHIEQLDGVFRPQHGYLLDTAGSMDFSHVGRIEALGETEAWLSDTLGRRITLGAQNASERTPYRDYYTPALRDRVAAIYARDIALLGYDF
jgi:hypothetical protein